MDTPIPGPAGFTDDDRAASRQRLTVALVAVLVFTLILVPYGGVAIPAPVMLLFGAVGGGLLLIISLRRPDIPLLLTVGYLPFSRILVGDFGGAAAGLNMFNALFLIIALALVVNPSERDVPVVSGIDLLLVVYILLALVALIRGGLFVGDGLFSILITDFKRWISPVLLFFLVIRAADEPLLRRDIVIIIMLTTLLVGLHGLKEFYVDKGVVSSWAEVRISGIAQQPNQLGAFFVYYLPLGLAMLYSNLGRLKYWLVYTGPILAVVRALMLTVSRGAFVSFGMAGAFMLFFRNRIISVALMLVGCLFVMFPEKLPETITGRMEGTFHEEAVVEVGGAERHLETSARRRIYALEGGLHMVADNPVFGMGHDMFPRMITSYHPLVTYHMDTHNTYLTIATEMGLPALLLFIGIFLTVFRHTFRVFRHSEHRFMSAAALGYMGGLMGLAVSNLFGSRFEALELSGWIWILAAVFVRESLELRARERDDEERERLEELEREAAGPHARGSHAAG